jgi:hypothetical protein
MLKTGKDKVRDAMLSQFKNMTSLNNRSQESIENKSYRSANTHLTHRSYKSQRSDGRHRSSVSNKSRITANNYDVEKLLRENERLRQKLDIN